ncbi:MAG TPA: hypothetical protein VE153_19905 [Myxococcus sp.]|jgi:hypothetical protein|nr:hypothetical protein [Myxococcus sp.]
MDIEELDPELEVSPASIKLISAGFRGFTHLANQILSEEGMGADDGMGQLLLPQDSWPLLRRFLKGMQRIEKEVGSKVLMDAGQSVHRYVEMPPTIVDIYSALGSIDIAYHMSHRRNGKPMFDPATGQMEEGIGHYLFRGKPGDARLEVISDAPYPCSFDRGIVQGMALRFKPTAIVTHGPSCRTQGAASCTYAVMWK